MISQAPQRELVFERMTTIEEIETIKPFDDPDAYNGSKEEWHAMVDEWTAFASSVETGDVVWEYRDLESHLGFVAGDGGYAIRRKGQVIAKFVTYAVG